MTQDPRDPQTLLGTAAQLSLRLDAALAGLGKKPALLLIGLDNEDEFIAQYGEAFACQVQFDLARLVSSLLEADQDLFSVEEGFAVLIKGSGAVLARDVAEMIRQSVRSFPIRDQEISAEVTVSIGVVLPNGAASNSQFVLDTAEALLAKARADGGDRVCA